MSASKSFGIDFGTTNSSVTWCRPVNFPTFGRSSVTTVPFGEMGKPIPSVVAIDRVTGEVHTGLDAWKRRNELERSCVCISSIKSVIDDKDWSVNIAGREWTAVDVASKVFEKMRDVVRVQRVRTGISARRGIDMDVATVAIPVGLKPAARRTIRMAAQYAGIEVESFVTEPTAAFFAHYESLAGFDRVLVFDWGGGTLDVSVLRHDNGRITELSTVPMKYAGDNIDLEIAKRVHAEFARANGLKVPFDEMDATSRDDLITRSEQMKRYFSTHGTAELGLSEYGSLRGVYIEKGLDWFEEIVEPIVDRAMGCVDRAISQAGTSDAGIDGVLLIGGSSNLEPLRRRMERRFGKKVIPARDDGWSVSDGAAKLSRTPGSYVSGQDVSIVLADGRQFPLLRKGQPVKSGSTGWSRSWWFAATDASQTLRIVFSGSKDIDEDAESLRFIDVPSYGFLEEKLILDAEVDPELVFRVSMRSNMRPDRDGVVWEYDRLKLSYGLGM